MGPITIQKDDVDKLPPKSNAGEWAPWGAPARPALIDWRIAAVLCAFLLVAGWLVAPTVYDWLVAGWGAQLARVVVYGAVALAGLAGIKHVLLVDQPGGFKLFAWQVARAQGEQVIAGALQVQHSYASNATRNVAALTLTNPAPALLPAADEVEVIEQGPDVGPLPADRWLAWLDAQPHALFAARTGKGKSTIAKIGLKRRIAGGESIFILDPHSNGWFNLPSVGGGENWGQIEEAMRAVHQEYRGRLEYREAHKRETGRELDQYHFPRLTVLLDEANITRDHFDVAYKGSRKATSPWDLFAECLGSGARKTGICVWLLVQSALVEDLGMTSAKRENFTRLALDHATILQLVDREERNAERKRTVYEALRTAGPYPAAAMVSLGDTEQIYLLDRTGLDSVSPPANSERAAWDGWNYADGRPAGATAPLVRPWPVDCDKPWKQIAYLASTTKLSTREIQAAVRCDYNLVCEVTRRVRGARV